MAKQNRLKGTATQLQDAEGGRDVSEPSVNGVVAASPPPSASAKKTNCPITRAQFRAGVKPVMVTVAGVPLVASPKEFSTGSVGWYLQGKTVIDVGGTPVSVQLGFNLTVVGSKELPE